MRRPTRLLCCLLIALFAFASGTALADVPKDTKVVDRELDLFWAKKREIKTIQKRLFLKNTRHEFTLYTGVIPNDDFFSYYPLGFRWNYYLTEDFSTELWGQYCFPSDSGLKDFLEENSIYQILVEIPQTLQWLAGASVLWSPFHGKFAVFTTKLVHFDFYVAFGAGAIGTTIIEEELKKEESKIDISGSVGLGARLYVNDLFSMRLDYRQYFYPSESGGLAYPAEITLGFSLWTPAPK
jgi:outer membrane beta-barrel protein